MHPDGLRAALHDAEAVYTLPVEELAGIILSVLSKPSRDNLNSVGSFFEEFKHWPDLPRSQWPLAGMAISEAWGWLISNGFLVPSPSQGHGTSYMELTRKARAVRGSDAFADYRKAAAFPRSLLHSVISDKAWPNFIRGDYDTAVFQAFKEVEVAVRAAGNFDAKMIGVPLMRAAFDKITGPLTDMSLPESEREALAHLFSGAIGSYKNPHSHRTVSIDDAQEAGEMLILASHLLRIVDYRRQ